MQYYKWNPADWEHFLVQKHEIDKNWKVIIEWNAKHAVICLMRYALFTPTVSLQRSIVYRGCCRSLARRQQPP